MTINKPIRGIFFDLGWTLLRPATGNWLIPLKALQYVNLQALQSLPLVKLNEAMSTANKHFQNKIYLSEAEELELRINYYRTIAEMLPEINITKEQADIIAYDRVYNDSNYVLFDDVKMTLENLKSKYRIGVISDTDPSIIRVLKNAGIYDYFDNITMSYELGESKTDTKIFEHALEAMKLPAEETVFIDDYELYLDSAASMGIQPISINLRPNSKDSTKYINIKKISDLLSYL